MLINRFALNTVPLDGESGEEVTVEMGILVVDCRHLIISFSVPIDPVAVVDRTNWTLTDGSVTGVSHRMDGFYDVLTTRTFPGVLYTITADVEAL